MSFFTSTKDKSANPNVVNSEIIGVASFFDFLCAVFSRIAYEETPRPLFLLSEVFNIIPAELIESLSNIKNISDLKNDSKVLLGLATDHNIPTRMYNNQKYINFIPYAKDINILMEGANRYDYYKIKTNENIMVESIATSNYGNVLIIGVKTMPNFIFTAFRGTYSAKTAASYSRPSSIFPLQISNDTKVLGGIGKILFEMMNTILESNKYMAINFLKTERVIPVFTGHSLGGGMATMLDYEYCKLQSTNKNQYEPLTEIPVCITFGSPRVLSKTTSEKLCKCIVENKTFFQRYSNDGDPITALPPANYHHPCSSAEDKAKGYRGLVSRDCKSSTKKTNSIAGYMPADYIQLKIMSDLPHAYSEPTKPINCRGNNGGPSFGTKLLNVAPNMFDHMTYLYISFSRAATLTDLVLSAGLTSEISRVKRTTNDFTQNDTIMAIYNMIGNQDMGIYKRVAIDLTHIRKENSGTKLKVDAGMNATVFKYLMNNMNNTTVDISFPNDSENDKKSSIKKMEFGLKQIADDILVHDDEYKKLISSEIPNDTTVQKKGGKTKTRRNVRNVSRRKITRQQITRRKITKRKSKRR